MTSISPFTAEEKWLTATSERGDFFSTQSQGRRKTRSGNPGLGEELFPAARRGKRRGQGGTRHRLQSVGALKEARQPA